MRAILTALLLLAGCEMSAERQAMYDQKRASKTVRVSSSDRIEVERVGVFEDNLAYNGERGVYIVRDKQTGAEFVGISGVGIAELGSHASGKSTMRDER